MPHRTNAVNGAAVTVSLRRDWLVTLGALALLAGWDMARWDLPLMHALGNINGFAWHEAAALRWLHSAGRAVGWAALAWMIWITFSAPQHRDLNARYWLGITVLCLLVINALKYTSSTSCPWDLAEFGGVTPYVSHWTLRLHDSGPGHCFTSGHASAAFAFFSCYFKQRRVDAGRAKRYASVVWAAGLVLSLTQIARGAHYPSHALWTAWLCWSICCAADTALRLKGQSRIALRA